MIRDTQSKVRVRPSSTILLALFFMLAIAPVLAHAGDQDGLGGYSMQLKRKYFDTGTGSGGSGLVVNPDPKLGGSNYAPQVAITETPGPRWLINIYYYYEVFSRWLR
jgi:hypothetical protein